nr:MAG TPA: hypothetical protein [Caudoviricetes sp.]
MVYIQLNTRDVAFWKVQYGSNLLYKMSIYEISN